VTRQVGLLGGTFDPIHLGHLVVADAVRDRLGLDELRLLVAGDPWMKDSESAAHHRVAMARAAVADDPCLAVDDRETRRDGPTYTADTLAMLHDEEPDTNWSFVLGADAAAHLPAWHRVEAALALATFVVIGRPGSERPTHALMDRVTWVDTPLVDLSSTVIRADVAEGRSIRYRVPDPVRGYIADHGLYTPA
jgi:nicotinate-nucleotide adenylyltransferase